MNNPDFLKTEDGRRIAYHRTVAQAQIAAEASKDAPVSPKSRFVENGEDGPPGYLFLGGFRSDMNGSKALFIEEWAREQGRDFVRFDYTGHGLSSGEFREGCIGDWLRDASDVLEHVAEGPRILIGSSMGGWIALLLARARAEQLAGMIGIAAAPDFTEDLMWARMSEETRETLLEEGCVSEPSEYSDEPDLITARLIEEGRDNLVLRAPLSLPFAVRLMQGLADSDVPWETAMRILTHIECEDARALILKDSGHRLSEPHELEALRALLDESLSWR